MNLLAFDTSLGNCSVAILKGDKLKYYNELEDGYQAERLFDIVSQLLIEQDLDYNDLDALALTVGPGSFTGIRIGVAAAKGLQLTLKIPVITITTLEALACSLENQHNNILSIVDAGRKQIYMQMFNAKLEAENEITLCKISEIKSFIISSHFSINGSHILEVEQQLKQNNFKFIYYNNPINISKIALYAKDLFNKGVYHHNIRPLYIKSASVNINNKS